MQLDQVANLTSTERFVYWIRERHNIYLKRKRKLPPPWTDDRILQTVFFTNPYREHDKVTQWFKANVRQGLSGSPVVIFATIAFRWFNWIPTGQVLLGKQPELGATHNHLTYWKPALLKPCLRQLDKVFTGAFNISNSGSTKNKIDRVCDDYIDPVWQDRANLMRDSKEWATMEEAHSYLRRYPGLGGSGFMAYEVVCDLRYTDVLKDATDKCSWSNPGPGAKRGINRIMERDIDTPLRPREWQMESRRLLQHARHELPGLPPLEMREIEHSLCEFDKYERARLGTGRVKRMYNGIGTVGVNPDLDVD